MLICPCNGISDRAIRRAVRRGATTAGQVAQSCGAGTGCGSCRPAVREIIRSANAERDEQPALPHSTSGRLAQS